MDDCHLIKSINKCNKKLLKFPNDIELTTTTLTCKINTTFNTENIGLHFNDFDNIMIDKKYKVKKIKKIPKLIIKKINKKVKTNKKTNEKTNEINENLNVYKPIIYDGTTEFEKNNVVVPKEKNNGFRNQVSIVFSAINLLHEKSIEYLKKTNLKMYEKEKDKQINVKIFSNGSFQMTGCKDFNLIPKIFTLLFKKIALDSYTNDVEKLKIENIYDFQIRMININFGLKFNIERESLKNLFILHGHDAKFKPLTHPAVHVKYNINDSNVTILIFNSGSITIAGKNNIDNLINSYYQVNNFILTHFTTIYTKEINQKILIELIKSIHAN